MAGLKRRKPTKKQLKQQNEFVGKKKKDLLCKMGCGEMVFDLDADTKSVICPGCFVRMVPLEIQKPKEKRPQGWHLRKSYISPSGIVYEYGKEVNSNGPVDTTSEVSVERSKRAVKKKKITKKESVTATKTRSSRNSKPSKTSRKKRK